MQRNGRRVKILEIIKSKQIETQEDLAAELFAEGFRVTQATISRDIKELGLIKIASLGGKQHYAREAGGRDDGDKIANVAYPAIIGCTQIDKIVVVKTLSGFGRVVKQATMGLSENLGSVADDDTVFVAFSDNAAAAVFYKKLNTIIY